MFGIPQIRDEAVGRVPPRRTRARAGRSLRRRPRNLRRRGALQTALARGSRRDQDAPSSVMRRPRSSTQGSVIRNNARPERSSTSILFSFFFVLFFSFFLSLSFFFFFRSAVSGSVTRRCVIAGRSPVRAASSCRTRRRSARPRGAPPFQSLDLEESATRMAAQEERDVP